MKRPQTFTKFGQFLVAPGKELTGELRVAGKNSELYVRDDKKFSPHAPADGCITGILHDLTKVSLLDCITLEGLGSVSQNDEHYYYAKLFPHFVLSGQRHVLPNDRTISQISFVLEDAPALFYDFDAWNCN